MHKNKMVNQLEKRNQILSLQFFWLNSLCGTSLILISVTRFRNKAQKRVLAINRELPPRNEQFLLDFEQIQNQFAVSCRT